VREAGFLSIEKFTPQTFRLVWRTLAGQNPYFVEISSKAIEPEEIDDTKEEKKIVLKL
jgi:hypothetical protein